MNNLSFRTVLTPHDCAAILIRCLLFSLPVFNHAFAQPSLIGLPDSLFVLYFSDEFNGTSLDTTKWSFNYPQSFPLGGQAHNHSALMKPQAVTIADGSLIIEANPEQSPESNFKAFSPSLRYSSGAINTYGKQDIDQGILSARIKLPSGRGLWPAFWMLSSKGGWPPEIDILELLGGAPDTLYSHVHYIDTNTHSSRYIALSPDTITGWNNDYHIFSFVRHSDSLEFFVDSTRTGVFRNRTVIAQLPTLYILLNLAVGGWAGEPDSTTQWPANLQVDWLRAWRNKYSKFEK